VPKLSSSNSIQISHHPSPQSPPNSNQNNQNNNNNNIINNNNNNNINNSPNRNAPTPPTTTKQNAHSWSPLPSPPSQNQPPKNIASNLSISPTPSNPYFYSGDINNNNNNHNNNNNNNNNLNLSTSPPSLVNRASSILTKAKRSPSVDKKPVEISLPTNFKHVASIASDGSFFSNDPSISMTVPKPPRKKLSRVRSTSEAVKNLFGFSSSSSSSSNTGNNSNNYNNSNNNNSDKNNNNSGFSVSSPTLISSSGHPQGLSNSFSGLNNTTISSSSSSNSSSSNNNQFSKFSQQNLSAPNLLSRPSRSHSHSHSQQSSRKSEIGQPFNVKHNASIHYNGSNFVFDNIPTDWKEKIAIFNQSKSATNSQRLGKVFGHPLRDLVEYDNTLPPLMQQCIEYFDKHALKSEGIFRQSGSLKQVQKYKKIIDSGGSVDFNLESNVHNIASLFKGLKRKK